MQSISKYKLLAVFLLIFLLVFIRKNQILKSENTNLADLVDEYRYSLDEANENIEEANSQIENAQWSAWESYEEMGEALDNLYTVDTISGP